MIASRHALLDRIVSASAPASRLPPESTTPIRSPGDGAGQRCAATGSAEVGSISSFVVLARRAPAPRAGVLADERDARAALAAAPRRCARRSGPCARRRRSSSARRRGARGGPRRASGGRRARPPARRPRPGRRRERAGRRGRRRRAARRRRSASTTASSGGASSSSSSVAVPWPAITFQSSNGCTSASRARAREVARDLLAVRRVDAVGRRSSRRSRSSRPAWPGSRRRA